MVAALLWVCLLCSVRVNGAETSAPTAAPTSEEADNSMMVMAGTVAGGLLGFNCILLGLLRARRFFTAQSARSKKVAATSGEQSTQLDTTNAKRLVL
jgi:hypothetical protein